MCVCNQSFVDMEAKAINPAAILLESIFIAFEGSTFSKRQALKFIGLKRLERLVESGEIEAEKPNMSKTGHWRYNAVHVLKHCGNKRKYHKSK